ncbi:L,D-transpeptidase family protein [Sphingomonas qilianensis]|uniref:L,D-transpeptidase family protein n=1 Tax=Sphingomonas qilianensis TaxID=1736690 RepID=A0ABU9XSX7_9SPHN
MPSTISQQGMMRDRLWLIAVLLTAVVVPIFAPSRAAVAAVPQDASVWNAASVAALQTALADRAHHGLDHIDFLPAGNNPPDAALNDAALRYARALAHGVIDPATLHDPFTLARAESDLEPALHAALSRGTLLEWLSSLAPYDAEYEQLSLSYRQVAAQPNTAEALIGAGLLNVGGADARLPAIIAQLIRRGLLPGDYPGQPASPGDRPLRYTEQIADAVKALQTEFGLAADGVIGPDTLGILNRGASDRARALAVALERRRWLSRKPPATRIDVNTAAALLYYYRDDTLVDTRRVVVGKTGTETPPLQSPIYRLVANPTWTVPKSIQNGELANVGADYFESHNMALRGGWIVQGSGPDNALGLVKFDMYNQHAIYLHDTSAPELFDRSQRHRSHGCVRVEDALGFAQLLAEDQGITEAWQAARADGGQQFVALTKPIPVRLLYHNAFVGDDGRLAYRTDPYGWNGPIAQKLGLPARVEPHSQQDEGDLAP